MSLLIMNPRIPRYVPVGGGGGGGGGSFSGPLGPAWYARQFTYQPIGTGAGGPQTQKYKVFIPAAYDNATPMGVTLYAGGSGTRNGTGNNDNDNTSQMTEPGNLPALVTATPSMWTQSILIAMQCPLLPGAGSRLAFYGMPPAILASVASEWNTDPLRRYFLAFSQGALFMMEGMIALANQTLFAAMGIAAGEVFGTSSTGTWLLDSTLDTNVKAANAVGIALGNTPIWQYNGENALGSGTDGAVSFSQAKELRDGIIAAGNTNYANPGSSAVPGWVVSTPVDHQGQGQTMFGSGPSGLSYSTLHTFHR